MANLMVAPQGEDVGRSLWAERINGAWRRAVESILDAAQLLCHAKVSMSKDEFRAMVESDLPFGRRCADMLIAVGRDARLRNHGSQLPASWRTLYEIQRLDDETFTAAVETGVISPSATREDVLKYSREVRANQPPAEFPSIDYIEPEYVCPVCAYGWRGKSKPGLVDFHRSDGDTRGLLVAWETANESARCAFISEIRSERPDLFPDERLKGNDN